MNTPKSEFYRLMRLRGRFEGHHALLVSNRREYAVERALRDNLGLPVTWVDGNQPRRLHAARARVTRQGCDLVMVATSFVGHAVDSTLKAVCKRHSVPYVTVKKGRAHACLTALAILADRG